MTTAATYENAKAMYNIGRAQALKGIPSQVETIKNEALRKPYLQGRASVEHDRLSERERAAVAGS